MTLKEFAKSITGKQYDYPVFTKEEIALARELGFVIAYGASDDLLEFEGAICDEDGSVFDGGMVRFDKNGFTENAKNKITAVWCGKDKATWSYETDIPHETFMIYEDDEEYCEGIVFHISDVE